MKNKAYIVRRKNPYNDKEWWYYTNVGDWTKFLERVTFLSLEEAEEKTLFFLEKYKDVELIGPL